MNRSAAALNIIPLPSSFCDERPAGAVIDTIIIHSMYSPEGADPFSVTACKSGLDAERVSTHYIIDREGEVWQCVPEERRAWHAGRSRMPDPADARESVNRFSLGVELIGSEDSGFEAAQYAALAALTCDIARRHPLRWVCGHSHIAPDRKSDPWNFDWARYRRLLAEGSPLPVELIFPEAERR